MTTTVQTSHLTMLQQKLAVDSNTLAWRWGIPSHKAKRTVQRTTQHGVRNIANLTLAQRFCTNDCMLCYHPLHHTMFTDAMFASTLSQHGNKCAQIFSSDFGGLHAYHMKMKVELHEALSLRFQRKGVPPLMVMDSSKEQTLGKFRQKLQDSSCAREITELFSPWQNAATRKIKELKKGTGRKLLLTNMPRRLWDNCLEYEAYVRSHTAHDIFKLNVEVPKTMMSGDSANISQFCELGWYKWVKFCSTTISFPKDLLVPRKYLGPSIDVDPAITAKILTPTGEVVHRSTYRLLMHKELADPVERDCMKAFLQTAKERWGRHLARG